MRKLLAIGAFRKKELAVAESAAESARFELVPALQAQVSFPKIEWGSAVLVRESDLELLVKLRENESLARLPVLVAAQEELTGLSFAAALNWGADDVVPLQDSWPLVTRLRALEEPEGPLSVPHRGVAVVIEPEVGRRHAIGRALRDAGFEVRVRSPREAEEELEADAPTLIISAAETTEAAIRLTERSAGTFCVISAAPQIYLELSESFAGHSSVRVVDSTAPPENLLFMANELARPPRIDQRVFPREPYGTIVKFRPAGSESVELGYTYNVSLEGVYVRTLAPPTTDDVWLELAPPRSTAVVRLDVRVAWRRPFGRSHGATVPPGFGCQVIDGTRAELRQWREGCFSPLASVSIKAKKS